MGNLLKKKLSSLLPALRDEAKSIVKEHGTRNISEVTIDQLYGGMRGVKGLVCDTSEVGLDTGLIIRGIPILELTDKLPEEVFYLLLIGELPNAEELKDLQEELSARAALPQYVIDMLNALPADTHPMVMFNTGVLAMEYESEFRKAYSTGAAKGNLWEFMLEDCLNIIARVPILAALVYRKRFNKGDMITPDKNLDWAANYAKMLGIQDDNGKLADLMRLYMVLHSDHEGGNVSAFTTYTVGSALSDAYYAISAGLNGLAGPLHGLANQECLNFIVKMRADFGHSPSDEEVKDYCNKLLASGRVIPGYGHAVLRVTDPRFIAFLEFGNKYIPNDEIFKIVKQLFELVPQILIQQGKAKDPWPNVDAGSGSMLYHYGLKEHEYYTVVFSVSRILGMSAQLILARGMNASIVRPKSVTTKFVKKSIQA